MNRKEFFENVDYRGKESLSGPGSEGEFGRNKQKVIKEIIKTYRTKSFIDIGCGDLFWMNRVIQPDMSYHGIDISEKIIKNNEKFSRPGVTFECLDVVNRKEWKNLTKRSADLAICLEVDIHLLRAEIPALLDFLFSEVNSKYLLILTKDELSREAAIESIDDRWTNINLTEYPQFENADCIFSWYYDYGTYQLFKHDKSNLQ